MKVEKLTKIEKVTNPVEVHSDSYYLHQALELAQHAENQGEVPVGALLVFDHEIIAKGWNQPIGNVDPTAHAEIMVLRQAAQHIRNYRLLDTTLYVTLEPCAMCIGAIIHARVKRLVFGAYDPRAGAVSSVFSIPKAPQLNHQVEILGGVMHDECSELLRRFFKGKR